MTLVEPERGCHSMPVSESDPLPEIVLPPREAVMQSVVFMPIGRAVGRIAGRALVAYSPGTAWLVPDERLRRKIIEEILRSAPS